MRKYIDTSALTYLWQKIKALFVRKSGDTMEGTLEVLGLNSVGSHYKEFWSDVSKAEVTAQDSSLTTSSSDAAWLTALLKAICVKYPNETAVVFRGSLNPNSNGFYEVHIYDTSVVSNGLPRYAFGTFMKWQNTFIKFWTNDYSFDSANVDTNTWNANSKTVAGYVSAPGAVANKVWKTDADGDPAWRNDYSRELIAFNNPSDTGSSSYRLTSANITPNSLSSVRHFLSTGSMTTARPYADGSILHFSWDNSNRYATQIAISHANPPVIQARYQTGAGQNDWGAWGTLAYNTAATTSAAGLMTAAMVTKLNGIATNATKNTLSRTQNTRSVTYSISANTHKSGTIAASVPSGYTVMGLGSINSGNTSVAIVTAGVDSTGKVTYVLRNVSSSAFTNQKATFDIVYIKIA